MMTCHEATTAHKSILETYDKDQLNDIAHYGCISGAASYHITYQQTNYWYDEHEEEILEYLNHCNYTTETPLKTYGGEAEDIRQLKNNLTWAYIELLAQEITLEMEDDD